MIPPGRLLVLLAGAFVLLTVAGCGDSGEKQFTPEGFVSEMNANGAALELGPVLTTNSDGVEIHTLSFTQVAPTATGEGSIKTEAGTATLLLAADADAAREEFARCERTVELTCFRAANAVLRAEGLASAERARITAALESLETVAG